MSKKKGIEIDPSKLSASCLARNPHLIGAKPFIAHPVIPQATSKVTKEKKEPKRSRSEAMMLIRLQEEKRKGLIVDFKEQSVRLKVGDDVCNYLPDFFVILHDFRCRVIECKGRMKWEDSIIKFKAAKLQYPYFEFQMWEYTEPEGWTQLY